MTHAATGSLELPPLSQLLSLHSAASGLFSALGEHLPSPPAPLGVDIFTAAALAATGTNPHDMGTGACQQPGQPPAAADNHTAAHSLVTDTHSADSAR